MASKPSEKQRALWAFLITTLAAPFLAGLAVLAGGASLAVVGRWLPPELLALDVAGRMHWVAERALAAFVWSAWPAALTGAALAGLMLTRGHVGWLAAVVAAALSATFFVVMTGSALTGHLTPIAFVAASIGAVLWRLLSRCDILR